MSLAPEDPRHGTKTAYDYHKCRCDDCRGAAREYTRRSRRRNGLAPSAAPSNYATVLAATWVRENHPDVWQSLRDQAYDRAGVVRKPPGRPRAAS